MKKYPSMLVILALVFLIGTQGCAHYRLSVTNPNPATDYKGRTFHTYLWGSIQDNEVAENCISNTLDEVVVTTNLGYSLVTIVTLGIWNPVEIKWKCAKETTEEGAT